MCLLSFCFPHFHQITAVDTVAEVKAAGTPDSGPTATTESTSKPPPFKDPTFMVTFRVQMYPDVQASVAVLTIFTFVFS